jgi:hypothetical protein
MTYGLDVEREGAGSDRGCDHKIKAGKTNGLEVEREVDISDLSRDYKRG